MRNDLERALKALPIVLPLFFVLYFFGYLTPNYEVTFCADNVVGDGSCMVNVSTPSAYSYYYNRYATFNSLQNTVIVKGVHYDVDPLGFTFSSVSEADFQYYEVRWLGIPVAHNSFKNILTPGEYGRFTFSPSQDGESVHIVVDNPESEFVLTVRIDYVKPWMWAAYWVVFFLLALLLSFGLGVVLERFPSLRFPLASLASIVTVLLAGCFFCNSLPDVNYTTFLLNTFLLFGASLILGALTTPLIGSLVTMVLTLFAYIANHYTILFRGRPVMPADLAAIGTAKEVLGGYAFKVTWQMALGVAVCVLYAVCLILLWRVHRKHKEKKSMKAELIRRGISIVVGVMVLMICISNPFFTSINSTAWDNIALYNFHQNGMLLTFVKYAKNVAVKTPEGYDRETVNGYLEDYVAVPKEETSDNIIQPTNIIMIMNEAFSDLRTTGLDEKIDVMPFIDSLQENTLEGSLYVSVIGGGTCNTEFEALTGNSLSFFSSNAYPYAQNINQELFSLASYFSNIGYQTSASHAEKAKNWNRDKVYPLLGFDVFHAIDDYPTASEDDYLHSHLSDLANYRYLESIVEENNGQPRFSFNVTMQNHSGFDNWLNLKEAESVKKYGGELARDAKIYLSLIKASDEAIAQLVETYRDSEEPTMIIFFGDHQPSLSYDAGKIIYGDVSNPQALMHTRFFIWTNYETKAEHDVEISANYLPWLILERGGFLQPPFIRMLKEVHEKFPVITSAFAIDADGNIIYNMDELMHDPLIRKYQYIQYANLFDEIDPAWFEVK